ncbi:MAG: DUF86 domain-containing protein [Deltaproteobacteria bacterium]|nr:DUF86 domain-containing protein [Deltaproteobacteria bacterium]
MSASAKDDRVYLEHIREAIIRIESYTFGGKEAFLQDTLIQDGVLRNLQTLAESTQRLSQALTSSYPGVEWRAIAGFRNILVHDYLGLDLERVWGVVEYRIPSLKKAIENMLSRID